MAIVVTRASGQHGTWPAPFVDVIDDARRRPSHGDLPSDVERLAIDLLNAVRGEVRFDPGTKSIYSTDASNYRQVPIGVVLPRDTEDVVATVEVCRARGVPIVSRGGGTSLAGQTCNVAVVIDHSKFNNDLIELNADERWARVRPGIVLDELRTAAERHQLTFGPDPATHSRCTLGGMIGNNSCGVHSVMAGKTVDNVLGLDVLTYDGTRLSVGRTGDDELARKAEDGGRAGDLYRGMRQIRDACGDEIRARFPQIPRRVSGYNLDQLLPEHGFDVARALVGSESTLVTVLEATVRLVPSPPGRTLVAVGYPDVFAAADDVPRVMESGCIACEGLDDPLVRDVRSRGIHLDALRLLPQGRGFLLVEFGGEDRRQSDEQAHSFIDDLRRRHREARPALYDDPADEEQLWKVRESGLGATAMVPGKPMTNPGWEDSAVAPERFGEYLRALRKLWDRYGYDADMYGHFGQGVLHCRIDFDLLTADGLASFRHYLDEAADLVARKGGSLSGEHGDGQARGRLLRRMFGREIVEAFEAFKDLWDPDGRMNPGKVVRANPILGDLRLGTDYAPPKPRTWFRYPDDNGAFGHAAVRCVGVGECRRHEGGVMCPSYMVTREEKHSTRGRARMLFELMNGAVLEGGWRNEDVEEALDLCLACKGCKGECPVNVDMATYKAEFRAHHYAGRLRPRGAYSMGLIHWWARLAAHAPGLANAAANAPVLGRIAKQIGGIAPERRIPAFAPRTFRSWWTDHRGATTRGHGFGDAAHRRPGDDRAADRRVILWVDTFTDHFHPEVARAAPGAGGRRMPGGPSGRAPVLRAATLRLGLPGSGQAAPGDGHPRAAAGIRAGVPIVGLEPSCVSVFRDEAPNLLHGHARQGGWSGRPGRSPSTSRRCPAIGHRPCPAVRSFTATATTSRCSTSIPRSRCCGRRASRSRYLRAGAAGWRAHSASRTASTTECRSPPASGFCSRRFAMRPMPRRTWSLAVSAAASRSNRRPADRCSTPRNSSLSASRPRTGPVTAAAFSTAAPRNTARPVGHRATPQPRLDADANPAGDRRAGPDLVVVFDPGDDPIKGLTDLARQAEIDGAHLTAIGAFAQADIGWFDLETCDYRR